MSIRNTEPVILDDEHWAFFLTSMQEGKADARLRIYSTARPRISSLRFINAGL